MKTDAPKNPDQIRDATDNLIRFWGSFIFCLIVLGIISAAMLYGLFLLMGYHIF